MNRNFPDHQAKAMAQLYTGRMTQSIRHTGILDNQHGNDSSKAQCTTTKPGVLREDSTNKLSHVQHFNMPDKLHKGRKNKDPSPILILTTKAQTRITRDSARRLYPSQIFRSTILI